MEQKKYRRIYARTFAAFLAVWLLMMAVLTQNNMDRMKEIVADQYDSGYDVLTLNMEWYAEAGTALSYPGRMAWMQIQSATYGGACLGITRYYDKQGNELARSPIAAGSYLYDITADGNEVILFDPVLTEEEQLSLAEFLRGDTGEWKPNKTFYGTESGKAPIEEDWGNVGLYGEVTGIWENGAVYPKTLILYYEDKTVTLVDSDHEMFEGADLYTYRFEYLNLFSALTDQNSTPERLLKQYRRANELVDQILDGEAPRLNGSSTIWAGDGSARVGRPLDAEVIRAYGFAYVPWRLATYGLAEIYLITLMVVLLAAWLIARGQVRTLKRERQFTRAVAHELKTPAAVLRAYAEALGEGVEPAQQRDYCAAIVEEADRMARQVNELLELSRMEGGAAGAVWAPLALDALAGEQFERLRVPMEERGLALKLELSPVTVTGDADRLRRLCGELAMNALRHAKPGVVQARLKQEGERAALTVENPCDPIPTEQLKRLWEPFYKPDEARGGEGGGMGLAVVENIVELHNGACRAELTDGGIRFRIELPV